MSGIYIKGMTIPPSCVDCDMIGLSGAVNCIHAYDTRNSELERASDCPLVFVPPHGKLVDADALRYWADDSAMIAFDYVTRSQINAAPTIIPVDKEDYRNGTPT